MKYMFCVTTLIACFGFYCYDFATVHDKVNFKEGMKKKLILILLDGFRWDYLNKTGLRGFDDIQREGVRAEYSVPVFPSLSYPNYYSIVTGLYAENHGIMLNYMYNPETDEKFDGKPYWWEQAEPLWVTATKSNLRADMYLWPGCDVPIKGITPKFCLPYTLRVWVEGFKHDLTTALDRLENDESDVALIYCEQPDMFGHLFGPESFLVDSVVRKLDIALKEFSHDLIIRGLHEQTNVVIVSDHGMTPVDFWSADKIPLKDYINMNDVHKIVDRGAIVAIYPERGRLQAVYQQLKKMPGVKVWKKEEIPESFHYKNNIRTSPLVLLADPGYFIKGISKKSILSYGVLPPTIADNIVSGFHGYDPKGFPDMRGIFMGWGPDFKVGFRGPPIENQDVYNLAMVLIGLQPLPNNGTWKSVVGYLKNPPAYTKDWH